MGGDDLDDDDVDKDNEASGLVDKEKTPSSQHVALDEHRPVNMLGPTEATRNEEAAALYDSVGALERRCRMLQKNLDSRPIIYQSSKPGHGPLNLETGLESTPSSEPWFRVYLPGRVGDVLACLCRWLEKPLRNFTQRLLQSDAFLWMFYLHLLVLYTIAASYLANSAP